MHLKAIIAHAPASLPWVIRTILLMIPILVDGMGGGRRKDGSISQEVCLKKEEITKALRNFSRIIAWIITNRLDRELRKLDPHSKTLCFHPKTVVFMPRLAAALIARGRPIDKFVESRCKACGLDPTKTIVLDITVPEARAIARGFLTKERTRHLGWKILCEIRAYTLEQHPIFNEPDTIAKLVISPEEALEIITRMGKRGTPRVTTYRLRKRIKRLNKRAELPGSFSTSNPPKEKSPCLLRGFFGCRGFRNKDFQKKRTENTTGIFPASFLKINPSVLEMLFNNLA